MVLDYLMLKENLFAVEGALIRALVTPTKSLNQY
jgi:hypothetical protein